jgi:hypothetical protein
MTGKENRPGVAEADSVNQDAAEFTRYRRPRPPWSQESHADLGLVDDGGAVGGDAA